MISGSISALVLLFCCSQYLQLLQGCILQANIVLALIRGYSISPYCWPHDGSAVSKHANPACQTLITTCTCPCPSLVSIVDPSFDHRRDVYHDNPSSSQTLTLLKGDKWTLQYTNAGSRCQILVVFAGLAVTWRRCRLTP